MSLKYLLDTDVLSEPLRPTPDRSVVKRLARHEDVSATAILVWHELLYGCYLLPLSKKRTAIEKYLFEVVRPSIPILIYDARAAEWHARERARLRRKGKTPAFVDGQIAAIAKVNGLTIVTNNLKHYRPFGAVKVEDWRK